VLDSDRQKLIFKYEPLFYGFLIFRRLQSVFLEHA